jgi:hypothetical protein
MQCAVVVVHVGRVMQQLYMRSYFGNSGLIAHRSASLLAGFLCPLHSFREVSLNSALLWCGLWMAKPLSLLSRYYHELAIKLENEFLDFRNKCVVLLLSLLLSLVLPSQMAALHSVMELVKNEVPSKFNNKLYFKLCSTLVSSPPSHFC